MNKTKIIDLYKQYAVPLHVQKHMKKVAEIGLKLALAIQKNHHEVNLGLVEQSALLHDMVKVCDFPSLNPEFFIEKPTKKQLDVWETLVKRYHHIGHEEAGAEILLSLGEPEIATVIKKHRFASLIEESENERPKTLEEKIVYYADKRVKHDQVVSVKERLQDGKERYYPDGNTPDNHAEIEKQLYRLENELCELGQIKPEDLA